MYPLYWTLSKGGIFMRYSYEFKKKAIELFYQGEWPETPNGVLPHSFHEQIRYGLNKRSCMVQILISFME